MDSSTDPILEYLLEFNKKHSIEYGKRYLIPPSGLQDMLNDYKKFKLNRREPVPEIPHFDEQGEIDINKLMEMI